MDVRCSSQKRTIVRQTSSLPPTPTNVLIRIGSCSATVSASLFRRWQVRVVPERGAPVTRTLLSLIVPPEIATDQGVEPAVVGGVVLRHALARGGVERGIVGSMVRLERR